jgi:nitrite reductase/ring-hydroxylating ferredoxin subunit
MKVIDGYISLCKISKLNNRRGKLFKIDDETEVALFKVNEEIYAVDNICPHNHTPRIYEGHVDGMYVSCPEHGFSFHLETGEQPAKAGCRLRTFEVKILDEIIYVKKPDKKIFDFSFE